MLMITPSALGYIITINSDVIFYENIMPPWLQLIEIFKKMIITKTNVLVGIMFFYEWKCTVRKFKQDIPTSKHIGLIVNKIHNSVSCSLN